jgi:ATP phosphoribosyltransferase regulatory subunit HisZ
MNAHINKLFRVLEYTPVLTPTINLAETQQYLRKETRQKKRKEKVF